MHIRPPPLQKVSLPGGGDPIGVIDQTEVQFRRAVRGFDVQVGAPFGFDEDGETSPGGAASTSASSMKMCGA